MNYVAIDTANTGLTVIVKKGEKTYSFRDDKCGVRHSIALMPALEELLKKAGLELKDVDFFAVVVGPGSFTGIRIGVSTVSALALKLKKPCLKVTSFDTMAYNIKDSKVLTLIDAKHGGFYASAYQDLKVIIPPCFISLEEVLKLAKEYRAVKIEEVSGIEAEKVDPVLGLIYAIEGLKGNLSLDLNEIAPLYIRKSQAEEGR